MKKLLMVFVAVSIFLISICGCELKNKTETSDRVSTKNNIENQNNMSEEIYPEIKKEVFKDIGKDVKTFTDEYGEISDSDWLDGPMYRFGENEKWYSFSEYDLTEDNGYIPRGVCTHVFMTFEELVYSPEGEYDIDVFEDAVSSKLVSYYNEQDMTNIYRADYKKYTIELIETPEIGINSDSAVVVTKK